MNNNTKHKSIRVFILAGGKGTRLSSIVKNVPKPMANVNNKPFLDYLIKKLKDENFKKISLLTGYKSEIIENYYQDQCIDFIKEETPLGTGGAIRNAINYNKEANFLILNGDTFFKINYTDFLSKAKGQDAIALNFMKKCDRYGTVDLEDNNKVLSFHEKIPGRTNSLINTGVYFLKRETILNIPPNINFSLEQELFPRIPLFGVQYNSQFIDIGIPEDYNRAQDLAKTWL